MRERSGLFVQVLRLYREAGMVKLGHVAIDGTKMHANASKHKAMYYGRMKVTDRQSKQRAEGWFAKEQRADEQEDAPYGGDRRVDELPDWVVNTQRRLAKTREAKATLEAKAIEGAGGSERKGLPGHGPGRPRLRPKGTSPDSAQ